MEKFIKDSTKVLLILSTFFIILSVLLWNSTSLLELVGYNVVSAFYDREPSLIIVVLNNLLFFICWCFKVLYKEVYHKKNNGVWGLISIIGLIINTSLSMYYIYALYFYEVGMWYLF